MRPLLVLVILLACKDEQRSEVKQNAVETKEQLVESARKAADEAKQQMEKAREEARAAWQRLEAARAEHAKVSEEHDAAKAKLAEVREQAKETVKIAKEKLIDLGSLGSKLEKKIEQAKQEVASASGDAKTKAQTALAELEQKRDQVTDEIKKLMEMISEIEAAK